MSITSFISVSCLTTTGFLLYDYIYGSNAVKVFALSYSPQDINCRNYTYDFNITVDNGQAIKVSNKKLSLV